MAGHLHRYEIDEGRTIPVENVCITMPTVPRNLGFVGSVKFILGGAIKVRGARLLRRKDDSLILCMPDVTVFDQHCSRCNSSTHHSDRYCRFCGLQQGPPPEMGTVAYSNICYPIHRAQRKILNDAVFAAYDEAIASRKGGATCKA